MESGGGVRIACVRACISLVFRACVEATSTDGQTDGRTSTLQKVHRHRDTAVVDYMPFIFTVQSSVAAVATCCGTPRRVSRLRVIHRRAARPGRIPVRLVDPGYNVYKPRFL